MSEITEAAERIDWIEKNIPTIPKWDKSDLREFYERDIAFLLPLAKSMAAELDPSEITLEALILSGWRETKTHDGSFRYFELKGTELWPMSGGRYQFLSSDLQRDDCKTMGEVRSLLRLSKGTTNG